MATRSKHYTPLEKNIFLQILKKYKHVIESKRSNSATLREKEVIWNNICTEFNNSSLITEERNVCQLKKLWTNLKQTQRTILTKERQARFATSGGPEVPSTEIDPDVADIAPHLMSTAPVLFTLNMDDAEIEINKLQIENEDFDSDNIENQENVIIDEILVENDLISEEILRDIPKEIIDNNTKKRTIETKDGIRVSRALKEITEIIDTNTKKRKVSMETEGDLKILRMKNIIEKEKRIGEMQLEHEKELLPLKKVISKK